MLAPCSPSQTALSLDLCLPLCATAIAIACCQAGSSALHSGDPFAPLLSVASHHANRNTAAFGTSISPSTVACAQPHRQLCCSQTTSCQQDCVEVVLALKLIAVDEDDGVIRPIAVCMDCLLSGLCRTCIGATACRTAWWLCLVMVQVCTSRQSAARRHTQRSTPAAHAHAQLGIQTKHSCC